MPRHFRAMGRRVMQTSGAGTCVAVVASGNADLFRTFLSAFNAQTEPFDRLVIIPWGDEAPTVSTLAQALGTRMQHLDCAEPSLEGKRNRAIETLRTAPPDWV